MAALVEICVSRGAIITGSDVAERFYTDEILEKLNIKPTLFSADNNTQEIELVVYSSAYKIDENVELIQAKKLNSPCILYSDALGEISALAISSGIAGVHGKTTTTGLTGTIIKELNLPAQVLAGSSIKTFGNCTLSIGHKYFVAETCEYQRHFMAFHPKNIILTSVESDHQDFYPTFKDIQNAFVDYGCLLPQNGQLIYCADDKGAVETAQIAHSKRPDIQLVPYGVNAEGDYKLTFGRVAAGKHYFTVGNYGEFTICVPGDHNVRNVTAAFALSVELLKTDGKNPSDYLTKLKDALCQFAGGKRRSEIVGRTKTPSGQEVIFIDDYGHHPTEIKTTLDALKAAFIGRRLVVAFQPHRYSRTKALLKEFSRAFTAADELYLTDVYSAGEEPIAGVNGELLFKAVQDSGQSHVHYQGTLAKLKEQLMSDLKPGDIFLTLGAGNLFTVGEALLKEAMPK